MPDIIPTNLGLAAQAADLEPTHIQVASGSIVEADIPGTTSLQNVIKNWTLVSSIQVDNTRQIRAEDQELSATYANAQIWGIWHGDPSDAASELLGIYVHDAAVSKNAGLRLAITLFWMMTASQAASVTFNNVAAPSASTIISGISEHATQDELNNDTPNRVVTSDLDWPADKIDGEIPEANLPPSALNDPGNASQSAFGLTRYVTLAQFMTTNTGRSAEPSIIRQWVQNFINNTATFAASRITGVLSIARIPRASESAAQDGTSSSVVMTPQRTTDFYEHRRSSVAQAQAGADDDVFMTPLKTKQQLDLRLATVVVNALVDAAIINWNLNNGNVATVTLSGNRTLSVPTNGIDNTLYLLRVTQDATGSRTLTLNNNIEKGDLTNPVLSTDVNTVDVLAFMKWGGTVHYLGILKGY